MDTAVPDKHTSLLLTAASTAVHFQLSTPRTLSTPFLILDDIYTDKPLVKVMDYLCHVRHSMKETFYLTNKETEVTKLGPRAV